MANALIIQTARTLIAYVGLVFTAQYKNKLKCVCHATKNVFNALIIRTINVIHATKIIISLKTQTLVTIMISKKISMCVENINTHQLMIEFVMIAINIASTALALLTVIILYVLNVLRQGIYYIISVYANRII